MPLESKTGLQFLNQPNASNLNVPPEFKVDIERDEKIPVDPEEIYRAGIRMMYDVTEFALDYQWLDQDWAFGSSGLYLAHMKIDDKDPSLMYTQFVIWGLNHLLLSMTLGEKCQTWAFLKWDGLLVGTIVARRGFRSSTPSNISQNQTNVLQKSSLQSLRQPFRANENVEVVISYDGEIPIDRKYIYLTGIKAMGEAAEKGLNRPIESQLTNGLRQVNWKLVGGTGTFTGIFRSAHSRIAVMQTLAGMIHDARFQKTIVWIKVDGKNSAAGGFSQGALSGAHF
ncbi:MAG: hypothetical protein Q9170_006542 [Blastenia crenularia]